MRIQIRVWKVTMLAICTILITRSLCAEHGSTVQNAAPIEISVDEIGKQLVLIGRLKKPLGTLMTVRGKWRYPKERAKDDSMIFTVDEVEGQKLETPVEFVIWQMDVVTKQSGKAIPPLEQHEELDGKEWTLRCYETGSVEIIAKGYFKETPPYATAYWMKPFTSKLTGVLQP